VFLKRVLSFCDQNPANGKNRRSGAEKTSENAEKSKEKGLAPFLMQTLVFWCGWQELNPRPLGS
jgi:hypothetical protein